MSRYWRSRRIRSTPKYHHRHQAHCSTFGCKKTKPLGLEQSLPSSVKLRPAPEARPQPEAAPQPEPQQEAKRQPEPEPSPQAEREAQPEQEPQPEPEPEVAAPAAKEEARPEQHAPAGATRAAGAAVNDSDTTYVTPLVRKLAKEHDVDLASLNGTGVGGRIRKQDVLAAAEAAKQAAAEPAAEEPAEPAA